MKFISRVKQDSSLVLLLISGPEQVQKKCVCGVGRMTNYCFKIILLGAGGYGTALVRYPAQHSKYVLYVRCKNY